MTILKPLTAILSKYPRIWQIYISISAENADFRKGKQMQMILAELDRKILQILFRDARTPISDIAAEINEPASTVRGRLRKLESSGAIEGYRPVLNPSLLGYQIKAIVQIQRDTTGLPESIITPLKKIPQITHVVVPLGNIDGLITVWASSIQELGEIIREINHISDVVRTETLVVLHEEEMLPPI